MIYSSILSVDGWISVLKDSLELGLIWSLLALGVFITYRILDYADLSIESSIVTGGAVSILFVNIFNFPPLVAFLFAFIAGFACGAITGLLHTFLKIPGILAGIIVMTGLASINMWIMAVARGLDSPTSDAAITNSRIYMQFRDLLNNIGLGSVSGIILGLLIIIAIFLALYWFFGTEFGMSLRATGNNRAMAKAQGVNTTLRIIIGLAISNALVALCGALLADNSLTISLDKGRGTIVIGLVSIVIGEAIFGKRSFLLSMLSVIVGSIIYQFLYAVAINFFDINPSDLKLIAAILITIILVIPLFTKLSNKSVKLRGLHEQEENNNVKA